MVDFDKILESLYTHFLLRDLAGKIVPGSVLYVALASIFLPPDDMLQAHSGLSFAAAAILIAVLWVLGLAVQAVGARCGLVKYSEKYPTPAKFHEAERQFRDMRGDQKAEVQRFERFEAIREAYGNGAASIVLAFFVWLLGYYFINSGQDLPLLCAVFGVSGVLFIALLIGHKETIGHLDAFWEWAIKPKEEVKPKEKKSETNRLNL